MSDTPNAYIHRPNREAITREPDPGGRWSPLFPEMTGYKSQGGGKVPADFGWRSNPKQWQEELTAEALEARLRARVLPHTPAAPALAEGTKGETSQAGGK